MVGVSRKRRVELIRKSEDHRSSRHRVLGLQGLLASLEIRCQGFILEH